MPKDTQTPPQRRPTLRTDLRLIADMIEPGSRVLDVGCGNGDLLEMLWQEKRVDARGIEIGQEGVRACVSRGLSVVQGDADTDLDDYPSSAFDYVVLSDTLQAMHRPRDVLANLVRIAQRAIVSLPNFAYWKVRLTFLLRGRMPVTGELPHQWYETPNIHFCSLRDFVVLCREMDIAIERSVILRGGANPVVMEPRWRANWMGEHAIFLLRRG